MKVAALVDSLFFSSKIAAAAAAAGVEVRVCRSPAEIPADAERVIVDLDSTGFDAIDAVRALKESNPRLEIVAFARHTHVERIRQAEASGSDRVLPRSAFVERLGELLGAG